MLTTKEAIENRRSIRKYKPDPIPDEVLIELLNSARLAPSGRNVQPWRFKIVKDSEIKAKLVQAAYGQSFIGTAPAVIVCCADLLRYSKRVVSATRKLVDSGALKDQTAFILQNKTEAQLSAPREEIIARLAVNVAIAIEHIVLRALDFGLGTCWIRLIKEKEINEIFGWDETIYVVALLPVGYPAEFPKAKKRLSIQDIIID